MPWLRFLAIFAFLVIFGHFLALLFGNYVLMFLFFLGFLSKSKLRCVFFGGGVGVLVYVELNIILISRVSVF